MNNNFKCIYKILSTLEARSVGTDILKYFPTQAMLKESKLQNIFRVMSVLIVQISALLSRDWNI